MFFNEKIGENLQKRLTENEKFFVLTFYATSQIKVLAWNASILLKKYVPEDIL